MRLTRSLKYKILAGATTPLALVLRGLDATMRKTVHGVQGRDAYLRQETPGIGAFLHCDLPVMALWGQEMSRLGRPISVLTSPSRDGQIFARFLRKLGLRTVEGSSNKRGVQGILALVRALKEGHHIGIVVDGPRGPRGIVKPGVIWLAQKSGAPIFPVAARLTPRIVLPTWDRAEIPLPFGKFEFLYGEEWRPGDDTEAACRELSEKLAVLKGEASPGRQ